MFAYEDSAGKIARQQHRDTSHKGKGDAKLSVVETYKYYFQMNSGSVANLPEVLH